MWWWSDDLHDHVIFCRLRFQTTNNRWWQFGCFSSKFSNVAWRKKFDYVFCCIKNKKFCHFNFFMTEVATWRIKYFSWYNSTWNVSDLLQCNLETILIIMAYFIALRALSSSQPKQLLTERHYDKYFIKVSFRSS